MQLKLTSYNPQVNSVTPHYHLNLPIPQQDSRLIMQDRTMMSTIKPVLINKWETRFCVRNITICYTQTTFSHYLFKFSF